MQNRRQFLKHSLATIAWLQLSNSSLMAKENFKEEISILHTNDVHSRIEPFPETDKKYPGMGGAAMRSTYINQIRTTAKNTLLLDAGDIFQGTPYFNFFNGSVEIELMNAMGYDCATIGNHDFDGGIENLKQQIKKANFPFVNCNYDFSKSILNNVVHKHIIIHKGKLKIGITGCGVELNGLVPEKLCEGVVYNDPVLAVQHEVDILKNNKKCDLIIVLSHLGYEYKNEKISDIKLAQQTENIDIIIGGHSHTFLDEAKTIKNKTQKDVLINQVGWAGLYLGKIDIKFEKKTKKISSKSHIVIIGRNAS
ncbi:MAG: metallophosphatase [Sphingobacteriales bacterium]|nr:MAG: metallophosphatase [Sphingobacteriales bacterium]